MLANATVQQSGTKLHVNHGNDSNLFVEFFMEAEYQGHESEVAGHPVYKDVPYISIVFAGDSTKKVVRPVKVNDQDGAPSDLQRFSAQWDRFQKGEEQSADGWKLREWPAVSRSLCKTLEQMNIFTVEQLAGLTDTALSFLGAREWREKARAALEIAGNSAAATKFAAENQHLKDELESLRSTVSQLSNQLQKKQDSK